MRRALHDDILPLLHTALLALNGRQRVRALASDRRAWAAVGRTRHRRTASGEVAALLADAHRQVAALLAALPPALAPDVARLGLVGALRRVVDDLGGELDGVAGRSIRRASALAAELSPLAAEVLFGAAREAIRNAARHGAARGPLAHRSSSADRRPLRLRIAVTATPDDLKLVVEDDGIGLAGRASARGDAGGQRPGADAARDAADGARRVAGGRERARAGDPRDAAGAGRG